MIIKAKSCNKLMGEDYDEEDSKSGNMDIIAA